VNYDVDDLDAFLAAYSREARETTLCLRQLILDVFPNSVEQIDSKSGLIAYGYDRFYKSPVFAVILHMKHINLMFAKGAQLPDPEKLLTGTGKQARHVKIRSEAQTQNPALRTLLKEAPNPTTQKTKTRKPKIQKPKSLKLNLSKPKSPYFYTTSLN